MEGCLSYPDAAVAKSSSCFFDLQFGKKVVTEKYIRYFETSTKTQTMSWKHHRWYSGL